jgi:hypothetical protein
MINIDQQTFSSTVGESPGTLLGSSKPYATNCAAF